MKKLDIKINKVDKLVNELNDYLTGFNSPLAPRGEGARQLACQEFHELMNELHKALYDLEETQLNMLDWSIESIKLLEGDDL